MAEETARSAKEVSRVLLLRNLSRGVTEIDIEGFVHPFTKGCKPKIYLQASVGRAFVEFCDEEAASNALTYFRAHPIQLKGTSVNVVYSKRDTVVTMHENANNSSESSKVLLASVTNLLYNVDLSLLHLLFSKYGTIEKIVTFSRTPSMYQALIQFQNGEEAKQALCCLHNRNIYDGCNTLQIQPSRLTELVVKTNSLKCYDYTMSNCAQNYNEDGSLFSEGSGGAVNTSGNISKFNGVIGPGVLPTPSNMNANYGYGVSCNNMSFGGGQSFGNMVPCVNRGGNIGAGGISSPSTNIINMYDKFPKTIRDLNLETCNKMQTPVVICYNLPDDITVQKIFNLFSLYGTVTRIKILRDKADTALIQYSDPFYASLAFNFLQGVTLNDRELQVDFSKNQEIKIPPQIANNWINQHSSSFDNEGANDVNETDIKTKTFTIKDQRYGQGDDIEKYLKGVCRPTATLFVANVDEFVTEEELKKIFGVYARVNKIAFKSPKEGSKTQMAFVAVEDEIEALNALINLHNTSLHNRLIKVAFSKQVL